MSYFFACAGRLAGPDASLVTRTFTYGSVPDADQRDVSLSWEGAPDGEVIVSYSDPSRFGGGPDGFEAVGTRSFLYDDALLALLRIMDGDRDGAARVLRAIAALQSADGSWGFSVGWDGSYYDRYYVRSGVVASLVYALAKFDVAFGGEAFLPSARRGASWLLSQRQAGTGLVMAGRGFGGSHEVDRGERAAHVVTEHQIGAYFALAALGAVEPAGGWREEAIALGDAVRAHLWIAEEGRFAQGMSEEGLDRGSALDAAGAWGALFLLACGRHEEAAKSLEWVDRHHAFPWEGGRAYRPFVGGPDTWFVEASAGLALAWHRLEPRSSRGEEELSRLVALREAHGFPLPYATEWAQDFPKTPAAGPSLWFLLVGAELEGRTEKFLWAECPEPARGPSR